jgi:adenylate kinase
MQDGTILGLQIAPLLKAGKLVPDHLVNSIVLDVLSKYDKDGYSFILDGFPRTVNQAQFLHTEYANKQKHPLVAVNITLNEDVTIQKLLGRRICSKCKQNFNVAHIVRNSYDMPAILPTQASCPEKRVAEECAKEFITRDDDSYEIIQQRLKDYQTKVHPLLQFYADQKALVNFEVYKGVKDVDALFHAMTTHSLP